MNSQSNDDFKNDLQEFLHNLFSSQMNSYSNQLEKQQEPQLNIISGIPKQIMDYFNMEACRSNEKTLSVACSLFG